jgi:predicted DNA-binding transcriptional regulator AlpA
MEVMTMNPALANALEHLINQIADEVAKGVSQRLAPLMHPRIAPLPEIPITPRAATLSRVLTETDVQREYGLSRPWLRKKRLFREDPPFLKIGKMVRYRREDIERFLDERRSYERTRSTSKLK